MNCMIFCSDVGIDLDDVYFEEAYNDSVCDEAADNLRECGWQDTLNWLSNLPYDFYYYMRDDWGGWNGYNADDIEDIKDRVLRWADDDCLFDEPEPMEDDLDYDEPEAESEPEETEDDEPVEIGCDMGDFFRSGHETLQAATKAAEAERIETERDIQRFLNETVKVNLAS